MNSEPNENKLMPSKKSMLAFVQDIAKLEQDEFTLRRMSLELRNKATSDINACEAELKKLYDEEKRTKENLLYSRIQKSSIESDIETIPQHPIKSNDLTKPEEPKYPDKIVQWQKEKEPHTAIWKITEKL